jgi:hypothetical protein
MPTPLSAKSATPESTPRNPVYIEGGHSIISGACETRQFIQHAVSAIRRRGSTERGRSSAIMPHAGGLVPDAMARSSEAVAVDVLLNGQRHWHGHRWAHDPVADPGGTSDLGAGRSPWPRAATKTTGTCARIS